MKWRLQYCASAQSAAGRRTPMHNIGAVMADALLKGTPSQRPELHWQIKSMQIAYTTLPTYTGRYDRNI